MELCDINPFVRYAELQPSVLSWAPLSCAYDYRIFYIVEGNGKLVLEESTVELSEGTLLYFRPGTPYYFDGNVKVIVIIFDLTREHAEQKKPRRPSRDIYSFNPDEVFENNPPKELESMIVLDKAFDAEKKLQECLFHHSYPTPVSDALTSALIKDVLCHMIQQNTNSVKSSVPELVERITRYIMQNYDKELDNLTISAELGYHSFYLNRVFKKSTGTTIHKALVAERIRVAKLLLRGTDMSVNAVAGEAGFSDRSQFCTAFKKHTGLTPNEYRQNGI